jgi:hypothetical protein
MMIGAQRFYGQRPAWWLFHSLWLVGMASVGYWLIIEPDFRSRIAAFSFTAFIFYAYQATLMWRFGDSSFEHQDIWRANGAAIGCGIDARVCWR